MNDLQPSSTLRQQHPVVKVASAKELILFIRLQKGVRYFQRFKPWGFSLKKSKSVRESLMGLLPNTAKYLLATYCCGYTGVIPPKTGTIEPLQKKYKEKNAT